MITVKNLFDGNIRHTEKACSTFYEPHLGGQSPALCIVYCSDSRQNIHIISDLEPKMGEIFTIQNAGNVLDGSASAIGSVLYCLSHLKTKELLILGHTGCGAVASVFADYTSDRKPIASHIKYLENVKAITMHVISGMEGKNITEKDISEDKKYLALASEINVDYQCEFAKSLLEAQAIEGIKICGMIHDLHGIYTQKKGMLILTRGGGAEIPRANKLKLADYGENRTIKDIIKGLNISFYNSPDK